MCFTSTLVIVRRYKGVQHLEYRKKRRQQPEQPNSCSRPQNILKAEINSRAIIKSQLALIMPLAWVQATLGQI